MTRYLTVSTTTIVVTTVQPPVFNTRHMPKKTDAVAIVMQTGLATVVTCTMAGAVTPIRVTMVAIARTDSPVSRANVRMVSVVITAKHLPEASSPVNYIRGVCHWKPVRLLKAHTNKYYATYRLPERRYVKIIEGNTTAAIAVN